MSTTIEPSALSPDQARLLSERLAAVELSPVLMGPSGEHVELPREIFEVVRLVAEELAAGRGVSVMPLHTELTTAQAAEVLNISRPHLVKRLEAGEIPFRMVGTHRRVRLADLLEYRSHREAEGRAAMVELQELSDEHDLPLV